MLQKLELEKWAKRLHISHPRRAYIELIDSSSPIYIYIYIYLQKLELEKRAKRLHVSNLPPTFNEKKCIEFFNSAMVAGGLTTNDKSVSSQGLVA